MTIPELDYRPGVAAAILLLALAVGLIGVLYATARRATRRGRVILLAFLRVALMAGIFICLLNPHWVSEIRTSQPAGLLVLVDTTRSMLEPDGDLTRLERAQKWWQSQAPGAGAVQIRGFDEKLHPLPNGETWKASDGKGTSLAASLDGVSAVAADAPIGRVILVSDGRVTDGEDPLPAARALSARSIPVSTLTLGAAAPKPSLHIENIDVPNLIGRKTAVRAVISYSARGLAGHPGLVRILSGTQVLAQHAVTLDAKTQSVELNFTPPDSPDLQVCSATLDLADAPPRSPHEELPFALRIGDPKIRVLYMEGSQTSEMVYLQRALQQGGAPVEVTMLHRGQGKNDYAPDHVDTNPDDGTPIYNVENAAHGYPRTLDALLKYDVVIWSDIVREAFSDDQMKMTEQFVEQYGGGFLMIGGSTSYGAGGYDKTPIDSIIPVAMENERREFSELYQPVATPEGLAHPVLALGATPEETRAIWQNKSPRIYGFQAVVRAKPGAVVLLQHPTLTNEYGPMIIMAAQEIGQGRSIAFTPDTTIDGGRDLEHLWGEAINPQKPITPDNCDSRYFRQFWTNAIRWLSARRVAGKNVSLAVETSKRRVNPNEDFSTHITWKPAVSPTAAPTNPPATIEVQISNLADRTIVQTLAAALQPATHDYAIRVHLSAAGHYLIDVPAAAQTGAICAPAIITCDTTDPELADTRANPQLMADIAKASGGRVLTENSRDARQNSEGDRALSAHVEFETHSTWDRWWILALLAGLLIGEWVLRRRWSMI